MIDKVFEAVMSMQGPDRSRKIMAICLTAAMATVLFDVATGVVTHTVYRYRIQTIQTLREEASHAAAIQSSVAPRALEETDILLNQVTQRLSWAEFEMRTPTKRLWSLLRPFVGGAALWFAIGIVVGFGSAQLPEVKAALKHDADATGLLVAQITAWFGVLCGLVGLVFNNFTGWWGTFILFPLIAGIAVLAFFSLLAVLVGKHASQANNGTDSSSKAVTDAGPKS